MRHFLQKGGVNLSDVYLVDKPNHIGLKTSWHDICYFSGAINEDREFSVMTQPQPHLVRIYLDPFTMPMLQQLLHFCRHSEEENTTSLTTWGRSTLQDGQQLHPRHQHFRQGIAPVREVYERLMALCAQHGSVEVEVHSNLIYSSDALAPLLNALHFLKYPVRMVHLYEDGTFDYCELLKLNDQPERLVQREAVLARLHSYLYETPRSVGFTVPGQDKIIVGQGWHRFYPTRYHMVRPDIMTRLPALQTLAEEILPWLERTDWNDFSSLAPHQQDWLFRAVGVERASIEALFAQHTDAVIVLGTSQNVEDARGLAARGIIRLHHDLLKHIRKSGSPLHIAGKPSLLFKGHPAGHVVNDVIEQKNPKLIPLPASMPMELLLMLKTPIRGICGFMSSSHLSLCKEQIPFILAPPEQNVPREVALHKWPLLRLALLLEIVDERQIVLYSELYRRGEIPYPYWDAYTSQSLAGKRTMNDIARGAGLALPQKKMVLGFHIGHPDEFNVLEKSIDDLIRMGFLCTLVIDETSPDFAAVCDRMSTVTRNDLQAFTLAAVKEAGFCFDCFAASAGRNDLRAYGYHWVEYGPVGSLGSQPQLITGIINAQKKYVILV
ncbi:UNVERIFIED_ORG: hypothetical protein J2Y78_004535 [Buttiauxella agrestis ATCC 33320]